MTKRYSVITRVSIGLLSFFAGVVSTEIVGVKGAIAAPDPIFNPVLTEIRQKMPKGWSVRLPSNISSYRPNHYVDHISLRDESFWISIANGPGCNRALSCTSGHIIISSDNNDSSAKRLLKEPIFTKLEMDKAWKIRTKLSKSSFKLSESEQDLLIRLNSSPVVSRAPITLKPGLKGTFISTLGRLGNSHIVWEQDSFIYRLSFGSTGDPQDPKTQKDKTNLINAAISMAKELPIEPN